MRNKVIAGALTGVAAVAASVIGFAGQGDAASTEPPKGARAQVQVSPNPTAQRGEEVTITGNCGGGTGLKAVLSGAYGGVPALENVRILNADPNGFVAKATVAQNVGNGVGPVFVDCGGEAGVTLLVTHV
jgi:hypothetical protein